MDPRKLSGTHRRGKRSEPEGAGGSGSGPGASSGSPGDRIFGAAFEEDAAPAFSSDTQQVSQGPQERPGHHGINVSALRETGYWLSFQAPA